MSLCVALYTWAQVPAIIFPETGAKCSGGQPNLGHGNWTLSGPIQEYFMFLIIRWSLKANSLFYTFYVWTRLYIYRDKNIIGK